MIHSPPVLQAENLNQTDNPFAERSRQKQLPRDMITTTCYELLYTLRQANTSGIQCVRTRRTKPEEASR